MPSNTSGHIPSTLEESDLSHRSKRRRSSGRPTLTEPSEASSNALATARRTLTENSPQRGSSRAMTPPEGDVPVKLTRTGRVSKATKGQRIHHCDECGKTYTRAEHLRRHQQNHKAGAFPCDVPGCGRSFYREDLLVRHKLRHDDPYASPSRQASPDSQSSGPSGPSRRTTIPIGPVVADEVPVDAIADGSVAAPTPYTSNEHRDDGIRTKEYGLNFQSHRPHTRQPLPLESGDWSNEFDFGGFPHWNPSPPYSPGYDSPNQNGYCSTSVPYFQEQVRQIRHDSTASFYTIHPTQASSRSPASAGSSTIHLPQWSRAMHEVGYQNLSPPPVTDALYGADLGSYHGYASGPLVVVDTYGSAWTHDHRDSMEQSELIVPLASSGSSSLTLDYNDTTISNEPKYLAAYWTWVHPLYTIIHQPSFNINHTSPLLKAAILALGAQACDNSTDKRNGRIIHERCVKVLQKRTLNEWHSFRICDMQAVVLVELFSVFKARRQPFQFSGIFIRVYKCLADDPAAMDPMVYNLVVDNGYDAEVVDFDNMAQSLSLEVPCKKRLLTACYILDVQHSILFGRPRTPYVAGFSVDVPFPDFQTVWDAPSLHNSTTPDLPKTVWQAVEPRKVDSRRYDIFQSSLILAVFTHSFSDADGMPVVGNTAAHEACEAVYATMDQIPSCRMSRHVGKLCKATPIRALLAVAGESWVMGEKLGDKGDFAKAQVVVRRWAEAQSASTTGQPINEAFWYAMETIKLHQTHPRTGLLFQEWAIYLAAVVIWARAYVNSEATQKQPRLSVPQPSEPRMSTVELDKSVSSIVSTATVQSITREQAKNILLWTKVKIERVDVPHNCGLTNGALDVLGKLITRGSEEGWFRP